jgi:hypothetical protein
MIRGTGGRSIAACYACAGFWIAAVVVAAALIALAPSVIGCGLAIAAAVGWCVWLEQHPRHMRNS